MKRLRSIVLLTLVALPLVVFIACGTWALWKIRVLYWIWWLLPLCWGLAHVLSRVWRNRAADRAETSLNAPLYWSAQDRAAAEIATAYQQRVKDLHSEQLADPRFYLESAQELALQIARHYHPQAEDPLSSLTVQEILAATRLATEDLETWVRESVPGSHLLTVKQWRWLSRAPQYARLVSDVGWLASLIVSPANLIRYLGSRIAVDPLSRKLQEHTLAAVYTMFLRQVGFYLIEMNSGRLRGGAAHYRRAMQSLDEPGSVGVSPAAAPDGTDVPAARVTVAVVGQTKAGKSSLINALLGERRAATDVVPLTRQIQKYQLQLGDPPSEFALLDTPGYAESGARSEQVEAIRDAWRGADLVLLVMNVTNPAREPDRVLLDTVSAWFAAQPQLKSPPVLGVLTHIDGLSPALEWSPPYDWTHPARPKEQSIRSAVEFVTREFGGGLAAVVPVCSDVDRGRVLGVEQWLEPVIVSLLGTSRASAMLRTLHAHLKQAALQQLYGQLRGAGRLLIENLNEIVLGP